MHRYTWLKDGYYPLPYAIKKKLCVGANWHSNECGKLRSLFKSLKKKTDGIHKYLEDNKLPFQTHNKFESHCSQIEVEAFKDDVRETWVHFCTKQYHIICCKMSILLNRMGSHIEGFLVHLEHSEQTNWKKAAKNGVISEITTM